MNRVCHSYWPAFAGSPHDVGALNVYLYALCHDRAGGALLSGYGA
jgi:hypothetical protein